jgi:hypothetical protein
MSGAHQHFGYWINRERNTARCYDCGFQFTPEFEDQAEDWEADAEKMRWRCRTRSSETSRTARAAG